MKKSNSRGVPKARKLKAAKRSAPRQTSAGEARAEGMRLFKLAGRPIKEDFVKVYGPNGPKMTWPKRAKAGVSAAKFQAALKVKQSGR